nr:immunoglobulin light chain junction region [Mus musculus]NSL98961.1 immunoglobulin light chain junction region [Mus musculus]
CLQRNAYPLTF